MNYGHLKGRSGRFRPDTLYIACAHSPVFLKIDIHGGNKALRYNFGQSKEYPSISNKITPHKNFNPLLSQTEPQDGDSPLNAVCPLELTQYIHFHYAPA